MTFRQIILFNVVKYLLTEEELYLRTFISLCTAFDIDRTIILNQFYSSKTTKLINKAIHYSNFLDELVITFPANIIEELLTLKLAKFSKTIKRSIKLPVEGKGIIIIYDNIIEYYAEKNVIDYIKQHYPECSYKYKSRKYSSIINNIQSNANILLFGFDNIHYFTYIIAKKVVSNKNTTVCVTPRCIARLLDANNINLLNTILHTKTKNTMIASTIYDIYLSNVGDL